MANIVGDARLGEVLKRLGADAILVTDEFNFHYLSGFAGEGWLLLTAGKQYLITDSRYTLDAQEKAAGFEICEYNGNKGLYAWLKEIVAAENVKKVGFENCNMTVAEYSKWQKNLPGLEFIPTEDELESLRTIKNAEELEYLAKAEEIGCLAFNDVLPKIKVGMTEIQLAAELEYAMKMNGAEGYSFETIVASGLNSAKPHHKPTNKKLEEGDFITMDYGCLYHGYCSDMTRTVVLGKASEKQKEVYNTVLKAQTTCCQMAKAGMKGKEVDKIARDIIAEAGYGEYFGHGLGHSVGLFIHEEPRFSPAEEREIQDGTIETIEPGIYIGGFGGVRIEDMGVVTKDGYKNLATKASKELIEIEV